MIYSYPYYILQYLHAGQKKDLTEHQMGLFRYAYTDCSIYRETDCLTLFSPLTFPVSSR